MYELAKKSLKELLATSKKEVAKASENHKAATKPAFKKQCDILLQAHIARHNALMEFLKQFELERAGCKCPQPLVGYRPSKGPRCRLCGCEVETEFDYGY